MLKTYDKYSEGLVKMKGGDDSFGDPTLAVFEFSSLLKEVTSVLWDSMVHSVVEKLNEVGIPKGSRIWWCPMSVLTSLPIHAAGKGANFLMDHFIPSYTPTLSALIDTRRNVATSSSPQILVIAQTKASGLNTADEVGGSVYDTSAKQRVPSWCDRILWKSTIEIDDESEDEMELDGWQRRNSGL